MLAKGRVPVSFPEEIAIGRRRAAMRDGKGLEKPGVAGSRGACTRVQEGPIGSKAEGRPERATQGPGDGSSLRSCASTPGTFSELPFPPEARSSAQANAERWTAASGILSWGG